MIWAMFGLTETKFIEYVVYKIIKLKLQELIWLADNTDVFNADFMWDLDVDSALSKLENCRVIHVQIGKGVCGAAVSRKKLIHRE